MRETLSDHIMLSNIPYQDLTLGQTMSIERVVTQREIILFAETSGDLNPIHLDSEYAANTVFGRPIAHGMLCGAYISAAIAMHLPGPGSVYRSQSMKFTQPVFVNDRLTVTLTVTEKKDKLKLVRLTCSVSNQNQKVVAKGEASVIASEKTLMMAAAKLPEITIK